MKREKRGAALLLIVAMVLTGIPSYAWASPIEQPVESSIIEETAEPSITEDSGYIEESEEQPVGQDQYDAHIYNEYDFVTALNGKCKNIKIEQDFELTKSYTIEEDMTIEMQGHNIRSNYRGTVPIHTDDIIRLTIAEGKKVQIISSVTYSTVLAGSKMVPIVNKPGEDYIVNIVRTDKMGNSYEKSITIHMADIKAKTAFTESKVKLYKKTPYYEAPVDIKPIRPCYGVITDVACNDPNYSFRLDSSSDVRFLTGSQMEWFGRNEYQTYYLLYTNHSSKNVKETKPVKVKVTFTYMSGITSTEELTIQNCDTQ